MLQNLLYDFAQTGIPFDNVDAELVAVDLRELLRGSARRIGTVDRRIYSNFIEHLGRCVYGGIFDEGSPLSDARGFRRDVAALTSLRSSSSFSPCV